MKIRCAVVVFHDGAYRQPGEEIDVPSEEAKSIIERFGECPADEILSEADLNSIEALNRMHVLHNG